MKPTVLRESENRWALSLIGLTLLLTLIPYLIGYGLSNGRHYLWLGYNLDDACVYLSWMKQAAQGHLRQHNLFTTEPQPGMFPNPLFFLLGLVASLLHLPLIAVFHLARLAAGFALLWVVWLLLRNTLSSLLARRAAFLFVCFSSGFGWLPLFWPSGGAVNIFRTPVDVWQPEAITFLSLYLSPLFAFSMLLQVAFLLLSLKAEQERSWKLAMAAGLIGLLIGLTHTYDVVGLALTWGCFLLVRARSVALQDNVSSWLRAALTALVALPGTALIAYELHANPIFRDRANVPTLSAGLPWVFLGYGGELLMTLYTLYLLTKATTDPESVPVNSSFQSRDAVRLYVCWAIAQLCVAYLPVSFQRKMLQGEHFPLAILAGVGAAYLLEQRLRGKVAPRQRMLVLSIATLLLSLTNIRFVVRDIYNDTLNKVQTDLQRAYISQGELQALGWIAHHTRPSEAIQPLPWVHILQSPDGTHRYLAPTDMTMACILPGYTGRHVYCGHWGETPDYGSKLKELMNFGLESTSDAERIALLERMHVQYLLFSQKAPDDMDADRLYPIFRGLSPLPSYLKEVYSNQEASIYRVELGR
ncbi:hypothetical protein [Chthonomonas calidirosea]|uniref:hypothetical protein n=1 Tax=Chthonomonas calidirosea TaxID=454171 RepID=UPI0006EC7A28|nr:hypothetical protein [Chthonomonas calidirosea]CEK14031.1 hypothetical protein CP488_00701 [Chthonomonas calidirosea]